MQDENNQTDLLQIKIDEAKAKLPENTRNAINAVDYKTVIFEMRKTKGYTFEQLGDLETETELLLCGLVSPEDYSKELGERMHLSKNEINELVKEMNDRVFAKIKENLVKIMEGGIEEKIDTQILNSAGIEIISPRLEPPYSPLSGGNNLPPLTRGGQEGLEGAGGGNSEENHLAFGTPPSKGGEGGAPPILAQKLSGYVKNEVVATEHSLENITKANIPTPPITKVSKPTIDPYREIPE